MKSRLWPLTYLIVISLAVTTALIRWGITLSPPVYAAIDPAVETALAANGTADFILYFGESPDLSAAYAISDWAERGDYVYQTLAEVTEAAQKNVRQLVENGRFPGQITRFDPLWISNAIVVTGDETALRTFASHPDISRILAPTKIELPPDPLPPKTAVSQPAAVEWNLTMIGATAVSATYHITGTGVVVGIIDTGVEWDHPGLINQYRGWDGSTADHNYNWFNPDPGAYPACADPAVPCDSNQHGTHVTGTAVGGEGENQVGVAPGAQWIHALGCCPSPASLLSALQWMLAPTDLGGSNPNPALRPQVVNNSWGGYGGDLTYQDAIIALRAAGIVPVFAAGNSGPACATTLSPADNIPAFTVGSTSMSDSISSFSSRGPSPFTAVPGPDLTAPGTPIRSTCLNGTYCLYGGTSQAAPHVAGAIALLLSAEPALIGQVDQIEEILRQTAVPKTSGELCGGIAGSEIPNNTYGYGRLDILAAVAMVLDSGSVQGTVSHNGQPISNALVTASRNNITLTQAATASGQYSFTLGSGIYTMTASAFGYQSVMTSGVNLISASLTIRDFTPSPLPTTTVSGIISDSVTGLPIPGVTIARGTAVSAQTTCSGTYQITLPVGYHLMQTDAAGYANKTIPLTLTAAISQNITLTPHTAYGLLLANNGGAPFDWIDITDGDLQELGDDDFAEVLLPTPFSFYGNSYNALYIGSNGFISFGNGYATIQNIFFPFESAPNNAIYGLATDLDPSGDKGSIYTKALPDGRFVIQFDAVQHWPAGDPETFEIILNPADGRIVIQYQTVSNGTGSGVGTENDDGSSGFAYLATPTNNLALTFIPFSGSSAPVPVPQDLSISITADDVLLGWSALPEIGPYEIWQGIDDPYFQPGDNCLEAITCTLAISNSYTHTMGGGDTGQNFSYKLVTQTACGQRALTTSNTVGEFDFALNP